MKATILRNERVERFCEVTGIKGKRIIVYKNRRYYYAIVIDRSLCVRLDDEMAFEFFN